MKPNETWNESRLEYDTATGRSLRVLLSAPGKHSAPPYHGRGAFDAEGRFTILETHREGGCALLCCELDSGDLRVLWSSPDPDALNNRYALHEDHHRIVFLTGRSMRWVDAHTGECRTLIDDIGHDRYMGCPAWSLDGESIFFSHMPCKPTDGHPPLPATWERVHAATGRRDVIWVDPLGACNHVQVCPANPDLLLIDRDFPPGYAWYGDYRVTPRACLLNHRTAELTELRANDEWQFHMHTNFNHDGTRVYYHGRACPAPGLRGDPIPETPQYVGASDLQGRVIWQYTFPKFFYGHVAADRRKEAILLDGTVSDDLLVSLDYTDGPPRFELLGRHGSDGSKDLKQFAHPHPNMTPDGRGILFNRGVGSRSEVCLLGLSPTDSCRLAFQESH